jgi:hypothetical protein
MQCMPAEAELMTSLNACLSIERVATSQEPMSLQGGIEVMPSMSPHGGSIASALALHLLATSSALSSMRSSNSSKFRLMNRLLQLRKN